MANKSMYLGQSSEHKILSMLLAEEREVYLPTVDDHGVDALVLTKSVNPNASRIYQELQIKSLTENGLFAAISCPNPRPNYWFVFYVKQHDTIWLINSMHFVKIASCVTKPGSKNLGKYSLSLATKRSIRKATASFIVTDFSKLP